MIKVPNMLSNISFGTKRGDMNFSHSQCATDGYYCLSSAHTKEEMTSAIAQLLHSYIVDTFIILQC